jgi:hypothetical protein
LFASINGGGFVHSPRSISSMIFASLPIVSINWYASPAFDARASRTAGTRTVHQPLVLQELFLDAVHLLRPNVPTVMPYFMAMSWNLSFVRIELIACASQRA